MREINKIIVHCSATNIDHDFVTVTRWHEERGFRTIGYHFGIDNFGQIKILRPIDEVGAHCHGENEDSVGICVLGLEAFTIKQYHALGAVLYMLATVLNLGKDDIYGHNEFNKEKTCPTMDMDWVKEKFFKPNYSLLIGDY